MDNEFMDLFKTTLLAVIGAFSGMTLAEFNLIASTAVYIITAIYILYKIYCVWDGRRNRPERRKKTKLKTKK